MEKRLITDSDFRIDKDYKVVVIGKYSVGKTCMVHRFVHNKFLDYSDSTLGIAYSHIERKIGDIPIKLSIWDTAGQERFASLLPLYFRHADVCIICEEDPDLYRIEGWYQKCIREAPTARIVLCVTKFDQLGLNTESIKDTRHLFSPVEDWCIQNGVTIFYTSALHNKGINEMFDYICEKIAYSNHPFEEPPIIESKISKCLC